MSLNIFTENVSVTTYFKLSVYWVLPSNQSFIETEQNLCKNGRFGYNTVLLLLKTSIFHNFSFMKTEIKEITEINQ
jgi:hypothetical protein